MSNSHFNVLLSRVLGEENYWETVFHPGYIFLDTLILECSLLFCLYRLSET